MEGDGKTLSFKVNAIEEAAIEEARALSGKSRSEFVRETVLARARGQATKVRTDTLDDVRERLARLERELLLVFELILEHVEHPGGEFGPAAQEARERAASAARSRLKRAGLIDGEAP